MMRTANFQALADKSQNFLPIKAEDSGGDNSYKLCQRWAAMDDDIAVCEDAIDNHDCEDDDPTFCHPGHNMINFIKVVIASQSYSMLFMENHHLCPDVYFISIIRRFQKYFHERVMSGMMMMMGGGFFFYFDSQQGGDG